MKHKASVRNDDAIVGKLRDDPDFAAHYLKAAMEDDAEPKVVLLALRQFAEALGLSPLPQRLVAPLHARRPFRKILGVKRS